jgi:urease accessory protein
MRRVDGVIGNRTADPDLDARITDHERAGTLERAVIDAAKRKRSRLRVETDAGTDLGIVVDRPELRPGDVLFVDEGAAAVVAFEPREAYVVDLPGSDVETVAVAARLGHRIGNQHWDVAVDGRTVYVPVEADRRILEDVLNPYVPAAAETRYEEVDAALFVAGDTASDHGHAGAGRRRGDGDRGGRD